MAFKTVYTLELKRRENEKKIIALYVEMKDMMSVLLQYVSVPYAHSILPQSIPKVTRSTRSPGHCSGWKHACGPLRCIGETDGRGHQEMLECMWHILEEKASGEGLPGPVMGHETVRIRDDIHKTPHRIWVRVVGAHLPRRRWTQCQATSCEWHNKRYERQVRFFSIHIS